METWRHRHEAWKHGHGDMELKYLGISDVFMKKSNGKRSQAIFLNPFA
jgi:hypothetical protein